METRNQLLDDLMRRVRMGARKAFWLSRRGGVTILCFGATTVPRVEYLVWLQTAEGLLVVQSGAGPGGLEDAATPDFDFVFDGYGAAPQNVRFALVQNGRLVLDSTSADLVGVFSIYSTQQEKYPLSILGLVNHWGKHPTSIFLADRSDDLIFFSGCLAQIFQALDGGMSHEEE